MYIKEVPYVPNVKIIKKDIEYSDVVNPPHILEKNKFLSSVERVGEYSIETCIKKILESNKEVIFYNIQYSEKYQKIYFYTNKEISTKSWDDYRHTYDKILRNNDDIIDEIKNILSLEENLESDCISLHDVLEVLKNKNIEYNQLLAGYESRLKETIRRKKFFGDIIFFDFDYEKNELKVLYKYMVESYAVYLVKDNGDLHIKNREHMFYDEILLIAGSILSELFDELLSYAYLRKQYHYDFHAANSNFLLDISKYGVSIFSRNSNFKENFRLSAHSYNDEYHYECNSDIVIRKAHDNVEELFKKIFVRIDDCPEWSREVLYQIRKKQLEKDNFSLKIDKIKRKIFPWINKKYY